MTSAETVPETPATNKLGVGGDACHRRPSFKCGGPNRTPAVRLNRRTVQALATKFNQMSQQSNKRPNRVVVGKPKVYAKPVLDTAKGVVRKNEDGRPLKNVTNVSHLKERIESAGVKNCVPKDVLESPKSKLKSSLKPAKAVEEEVSIKNAESIYEVSCLPVRAAVGLFEGNGGNASLKRPVAAVKPMVKTEIIEQKAKPKLAPKDSLSRGRYKVLRRPRDRESDEENDLDECDKKMRTKSVEINIGSMQVRTEEIVISRSSVDEELTKEVRISPKRPTVLDLEEDKDAPVEIANEQHSKTTISPVIELRKKLNNDKFEAVRQKLSDDNIILVNSSNDSAENCPAQNRLNDIFMQISQSSVPLRYIGKTKSEVKYEEITAQNAEHKTNPIFEKISQTQIGKAPASKGRSFARLLNGRGAPTIVLEGVTEDSSSDDLIRREVEQLFDEAVKSAEVPVLDAVDEEVEEDKNLKPNSSFLWSKPSPEPEVKAPSPGMGNTPLPKPPEAYFPDVSYDRSNRNSVNSDDGTEYDEISLNSLDCNTYDVIGVTPKHTEGLYKISPMLDTLDTLNVYEDIASVRANMAEYEMGAKEDNYEVVGGEGYESVYGGDHLKVILRSDCSTKSSFEKLNSLYESATGILPGMITGGGSDCSSEYQKSNAGSAEMDAVSSSSHSNDTTASDDWVDVCDSDTEETEHPNHGKTKRPKTGPTKPKRNWAELQKRTIEKDMQEEVSALNEDEHVYASIPESELTPAEPAETAANGTAQSDDLIDDSDDFDDFSSDDEFTAAKLPAEPVQPSKLTESLKAAGKKLRQNLTLRKSDFKSLNIFRPRPKTESYEDASSKFYCDLPATAKSRPSDPPPPPPPTTDIPNGSGVQYADVRVNPVNGTELYCDIGLFKKRPKSNSTSSASLYAESGLYGTKDAIPSLPMFADEPLYQFYTECVNAEARDDILQHYDSDGYEALNNFYTIINDKRRTLDVKVAKPNLEDFADAPPIRQPFNSLNRTLWCQVPEIINSCILTSLTEEQRKLQEAKFEILTSEGSYIHSLTVLETHFMPKLCDHITNREYRMLFSNILSVKAVSMRLMSSLEACWTDSVMLPNICEVLHRHAKEDFHVYVKFCINSATIYRTLKSLIGTNTGFTSALAECESSPVCQSLSLNSFLLLPMQRITRLPLLLGQVLTRLSKDDPEYLVCQAALQQLNKIVKECDDEATRMEKTEEMLLLSQQLSFPKGIKPLPIISANRCLVKSGSASLLLGKEDSKLTFGRRVSRTSVKLLLFTDLLIVARARKDRRLRVIDYCPRNLVQILPASAATIAPVTGHKHVIMLTLLENHENKTVEMLMSLELESDMARWQDAVCPVLSDNPMESVYESWDCPQAIAISEYSAPQPDELSLCIGDVVNVFKKIPDGWYLGERLRDGARGWFPSNHTQEISSAHVRAKNKKQRYKVLALTSSFIQENQLSTAG